MMFSRIGDVLPRCRDYERLFPSFERLKLAIADLYLDILKFCIEAKAVFRKTKNPSGKLNANGFFPR